MGKLVDMAYTAKEKKERNKKMDMCVPSNGPDYPYGMTLHLEDEHLKKLGMDKLPDVGGMLTLEARVEVISVSQNSDKRNNGNRRVELQIQRLGLEKGAGSMVDAIDDALAKAK